MDKQSVGINITQYQQLIIETNEYSQYMSKKLPTKFGSYIIARLDRFSYQRKFRAFCDSHIERINSKWRGSTPITKRDIYEFAEFISLIQDYHSITICPDSKPESMVVSTYLGDGRYRVTITPLTNPMPVIILDTTDPEDPYFTIERHFPYEDSSVSSIRENVRLIDMGSPLYGNLVHTIINSQIQLINDTLKI